MTTLEMDAFFCSSSKVIFFLYHGVCGWCFLLVFFLSASGGEKRCTSTLSHLPSAGMFTQAKQELFSRCC